MRIHIGCGTVYLKDWVNVDLPGPRCFLAPVRPDLVEQYITTDKDYYARHKDNTIEKMQKPRDQEYVCDLYGSFDFIPCADGLADEILARHVFEHLSIREGKRALIECNRALRIGGILRLDVPDHEESLKLLMETQDPFYSRHILGPRRNDFGYHVMGYSRERLRALVESQGFEYVLEEANIHLYPAFCLRFRKIK